MSKEIGSKDRENIIKRIYERMKHDFKEEEFYAIFHFW